MSKETFYFSHDYNARNDMKIQALLVEHGAAGYGVYWIIVEILHEESDKKLKLNNLTNVAIARQASTSIEQVKAIVDCCLAYELFVEEDGFFFSKRILKNIDKRMGVSKMKAKAGRISAIKRKKATSAEQSSTGAEQNSTCVEQNSTRVEQYSTCVDQHPTKERKEKERKEKSIVDTYVSMSDAEHPTQEKIDYRAVINFFNDETQGVFGNVMYPISENGKTVSGPELMNLAKMRLRK